MATCTGTCNDNCLGCGSGCWSTCGGCGSGCTGCTGCGGACSNNCDGCDGCDGCSGCGNACSSNCTACTNTCTGHCDNGCNTTANASAYQLLGSDIITKAIISASDVTEVETFIINELTRRSITPIPLASGVTEGLAGTAKPIQAILDNCKKAGYAGSDVEGVGTTISAARLQKYVTYAKALYNIILVS